MKSLLSYWSGGGATGSEEPERETQDGTLRQRARHMAEQICAGFQYHDRNQRADAIDAFYEVDRNQFAHLDDDEARRSARLYVSALWKKDEIERSHTSGRTIDTDTIGDADWSEVREPFRQRAAVVGMDEAYADYTLQAWRRHKSNGEYWTPLLRAQQIEYRRAIGEPTYPAKPSQGQSGFGPGPARYLLGVELHDVHRRETWDQAIRVMMPYYRGILRAHQGESPY
jgi:hypothetical protein